MGLRIQNNVEAFNTHRQLTATSTQAGEVDGEALQRLPHQPRRRRRRRPRHLARRCAVRSAASAQAQRNAQDGISLVQTAEGALNEVHSMLQRVRDLKVQYQNGTLSTDDKDAIAAEVSQISGEIGNISTDTKFNGSSLLGGGDVHVPGRRQRRRDDHHDRRRPQRRRRHLRHRRPRRAHRPQHRRRWRSRARRPAALSTVATIDNAIKNVSDRPRQLRRGPEPSRASPEQPGDLPGEPDRVRVAHPRRGHGVRR